MLDNHRPQNRTTEKAFVEKLSARIAPRNAWQAMDLGVRIYQTWWKPLTLIWLTVTLIPLLLILFLTGEDYAFWGVFGWWWLKPLWERPLLEYCARALFSDAPTVKQLIRDFPRHTLSGITPWLFFRRLDPSRGMRLAVTQLEKQRGESYKLRVRNLSLGINDHSGSLTALMLLIEQLIMIGIIMLIAMLAPDQYYLREVDWLLDSSRYAAWIAVGAWYLAMVLCEPLYICCSFALYLNKRTWLEGWDLELGMRQIGEKRQTLLAKIGTPLLLICVLGISQWPTSGYASSQAQTQASSQTQTQAYSQDQAQTDQSLQDSPQENTPENAQLRAIEILSGTEFMPMQTNESWRFKELWADDVKDEEDEEESERDMSFFKKIANAIVDWFSDILKDIFVDAVKEEQNADDSFEWPTVAEVFRFIIWVIVVSLSIWVALHARRWLALIQKKKRYSPRATHVAGLDIRPESLPDDVSKHVLAALENGNLRDALSLLYRATLSTLLSRIDVDLVPGATESECLRALEKAKSPAEQRQSHRAGIAFLQTITPLWMSTAWAHRPPQSDEIRALALQWRQLFQRTPMQQLSKPTDTSRRGDS